MNYPNIKLSEDLAKSFIVDHILKNDTEFYDNQVYYTVQSRPITTIDNSITKPNISSMLLYESFVEVFSDTNRSRVTLKYQVNTSRGLYEVIIKSKDRSGSKLLELFNKLRSWGV